MKKASSHTWQFTSHFRRKAFGWRSDLPIKRIKEAVKEIKTASKKEPVLAAEAAVLLLEKLSPALMNVDSSSGSIGNCVNKAIDELVLIIVKPEVSPEIRYKWVSRLLEAIQEDNIPYIEYLGDFIGKLCVTPELASLMADELISTVKMVAEDKKHAFSNLTDPCFSCLLAANRHDELLALLESRNFQWWNYRRWGVDALRAMNKPHDALNYIKNTNDFNKPEQAMALVCEDILLSMGKIDEAYDQYALTTHQKTTYLATFRAISKKYPDKPAEKILQDLVDSEPGEEGMWFAAAKDAGLFEAAIALVSQSPTDPRTLTRAAKDYVTKRPEFALAAGMASLRWMIHGYGYEISKADLLLAYTATCEAACAAGKGDEFVKQDIQKWLSETKNQLATTVLQKFLIT